jgi:sulfur-oxidizing protein SoxY
MTTRRQALRGSIQVGLAALLATRGTSTARAETTADYPWPALASQVFGDKPIADGAGVLALDAPYRAEDAALVPVMLSLASPTSAARRAVRVTLLIDANPSPLAATFEIGPDSGIDRIATRVRVNDYTDMHAVAELADGTLVAVKRYVKAAGGCSAPAITPSAGGPANGAMRWRLLPEDKDAPAGLREAELMIRHPNNSGMQMDQFTRLYVPAHFVTRLAIWQGARPLLALAGGISLAENPAFRFRFRPAGEAAFRAEAEDSKDGTFRGEWAAQMA